MVKKLKSKKRKIYKDPLSNSRQKYEKIKNHINKAPSNPDVQEIPKALRAVQAASKGIKRRIKRNEVTEFKKKKSHARVSQQKNGHTSGNIHKKNSNEKSKKMVRSKNNGDLIDTAEFLEKNIGFYPHNGRPFKPIPTLKQYPGESFYSFRKRVQAVTDTVIHESQFRDKYNVDIVRNEAGEITKVVKQRSEKARQKRRLREKEKRMKLKLKKNKKKSKLDPQDSEEESNPEEDEEIDVKEKKLFRKEKVSFGEVVDRPPTLNTEKLDKLLNSKKEEKNFLFIQNLRKEAVKNSQHKKPSRLRKEEVRNLEAERIAAVQAYRQQKLMKKTPQILGMIT